MINFWQRKPAFNNQPAAIDRAMGPAITYAELHTLAESINIMLPKEKQLVALLWTNSIHCLAGYLSALKGGHTVMLLNGYAPAQSVYPLLQTYMPNYVWKPQNWGKPDIELGVTYSLMPFNNGLIELNYDLAVLLPLPEAGEGGLMRFSYESLQHQAESIAEFLSIAKDEVILQFIPYLSAAGLGILNACLERGACQVFSKEVSLRENLTTLINEEKPTLLLATSNEMKQINASELADRHKCNWAIVNILGNKVPLPNWVMQKTLEPDRKVFILFQIPSIGIVSGYVLGEMQNQDFEIGSALPLTRLDISEKQSQQKIKQANTEGNIYLTSIGIPLGPATELADLLLTDLFCGSIALNCSGYFEESGKYFISTYNKG